eukprot:gene24143-56153_t
MATMPDHMATMPDHMAALPDHMATMPDHMAALPDHMAALPDHMAALPDHMATMPDHMAALPDHMATHSAVSSPPTACDVATPQQPPVEDGELQLTPACAVKVMRSDGGWTPARRRTKSVPRAKAPQFLRRFAAAHTAGVGGGAAGTRPGAAAPRDGAGS